MRKIIFMVLTVPALLISMVAGTYFSVDAEMKSKDAAEPTMSIVEESTVQREEIVLSTEPPTEAPTEPPTEPSTEPTVPETEAPTEPPATEPPATEPPATEPPKEADDGWTSLGTFNLTAYCPCSKCCGQHALNRPKDENGNPIVYTASGARAEAGVTIAVDPRVIPYGTKVQINGHTYIAQDTGGAIKGNRIDVYFDDHQEAWNFGTQKAEVFVNA